MSKFFNSQKKIFILLAAILLVALWFRAQSVLYGTFAFTYDVGRDMLAISKIVETFDPPLIGATTGHQGVFYGPTWYYMMTPFYLMFQGDPSGMILVMAVTGVLTAFFGFLIGKKISGNLLGIIMAFFIALSAVLIAISAQFWNPNPIPLFIAIALYLLFSKILDKKFSWKSVILLGILLGIIFDLEIVFGVLFTTSIIIFLLTFKKESRNIKFLGWIIGGFLIVQLPRVLFELRHEFLMTKALFGMGSSQAKESLFTPIPNFQRTFQVFLHIWTDTITLQNFLLGILFIFVIILSLIYLWKKLTKFEIRFVQLLLIVLFIFITGLSFFNHDIESHYYVGIPLIFILLASFVIYTFYKYLKLPFAFFIPLLILFGASVNQLGLLDTFQKNTWVGDASVYRNQVEVIDYIYKDANGQPFNYITYTPPIFDYPYQYLFQWRGEKEYGYMPDVKTQNLFYVIIEPDPQFPSRLTDWLELRKSDGLIIHEEKFPSGIILQKRIH